MNAATVKAAEAAGATETAPAPRPMSPTHGLFRAMLRLHQSAVWFWGLLVLLTAGALLWAAGPGVDAAWAEYDRPGCHDGEPNLGCDTSGPAYDRYDTAVQLASAVIGLAPILAALWAGASLIGRELENGTAQLAWTQSVSPARWLAAKLAVPAALLTAGMLLLTLSHRLMWSEHIGKWGQWGTWEWYESQILIANGPLATAHVLLGLAAGVLTGLLTRRSLTSLGYGFFAMVGLLYVLGLLRPYLWPAVTATTTPKEGYPDILGMTVTEGALGPGGDRVPDPCLANAKCALGADGITGYYRDYHPSSHFWPLQLVETGIALAVTALLVLAAFVLLRRRTEGVSSPRTGGTP
ncbi:ABC transporter permease [Streptomyces tailanensis]|uniref:ABC transporter permease n=1 Tax=Streptomyces tailanensis TaxID=2569858 RepID=UPI001FE6C2B7|nr:ABC transporter permease [Streptomyces tailanensis]